MVDITKNKNKAFSLAELLLAMTIVGVISALTVPSLKHHADEAKFVAATQKAMSEIAAITASLELKHGDASTWGKFNSTTMNWYKNEANTVPLPNSLSTNSRKKGYQGKLLSGDVWTWFYPDFMTADGMLWRVLDGGYPCGGGAIIIDVNGPELPNTVGIDIHGFRIGHLCGAEDSSGNAPKLGDFGIYAMGDNINDKNGEWACTSYVIKHKEMPWLHQRTANCHGYLGK